MYMLETTITLPLNYDQVEEKSYLSHRPISILLYRSSCLPLFPQEIRGARASLRYLCARRRLQINEWRLVRALPTKCRVGHFGETNPMLSNARASVRAPQEHRRPSWFSSADSQRWRMIKNTAMRTPESERHPAGASCASSLPTALLPDPVVLPPSAKLPSATLLDPVVFLPSAKFPSAVLNPPAVMA